MDLTSFILPQVVEKVNSPINGEIQVIKYLGDTKIIVNKILQSGGLVGLIWKKGISKLKAQNSKLKTIWQSQISLCETTQNLKLKNVLILGLGGGTAAKIINNKFPQAKIIGIEIDPAMINLGKKYFGLDRIKNLTIINEDALKTPPRLRNSPKAKGNLGGGGINYDLILVDLYLGGQIPLKSESDIFLKSLKRSLSKDGIVIFNRLFYGKNRQLTEEFIYKLEKQFSKIELLHAWSNLLVVCYK